MHTNLLDKTTYQKLATNAKYYTDPEIQALAEETGGCVADSLEMARFGARHDADMIIVAGVRFMGETAKILTPNKTVVMPTQGRSVSEWIVLEHNCE